MLETDKSSSGSLDNLFFDFERKHFNQVLMFFEKNQWISSYRTESAARLSSLRHLLGGPCPKYSSRSHKKIHENLWFGIQVESLSQVQNIGIDFEDASPHNLDWNRFDQVRVQLGLLPSTSPRELITQWSARQAIFKSSSNFSENSDSAATTHSFELIKTEETQLDSFAATRFLFRHQDNRICQIYTCYTFWRGHWVLSIATPSDKTPF
jgi:hypothetical protein